MVLNVKTTTTTTPAAKHASLHTAYYSWCLNSPTLNLILTAPPTGPLPHPNIASFVPRDPSPPASKKCNEELDMVLARLETEAAQARNAARAQAQREAAEAAALQAKDLEVAQELETRAMER